MLFLIRNILKSTKGTLNCDHNKRDLALCIGGGGGGGGLGGMLGGGGGGGGGGK